VREYSFLLSAALLAAAYAVVHDQIAVTLSPEYFVYGKGLDPAFLGLDVAWLAVRAGASVGSSPEPRSSSRTIRAAPAILRSSDTASSPDSPSCRSPALPWS